MKAFLLTLLVLTSGCAKIDLMQQLVQVPADVRPYYSDFFDAVGHERQMLGSIVFGAHDQTVFGKLSFDNPAGQCLFYGTNYKVILDLSYWENLNDNERRTLFYHELTHCIFGSLDHSSHATSYMFTSFETNFTKSELNNQLKNYTIALSNMHPKLLFTGLSPD